MKTKHVKSLSSSNTSSGKKKHKHKKRKSKRKSKAKSKLAMATTKTNLQEGTIICELLLAFHTLICTLITWSSSIPDNSSSDSDILIVFEAKKPLCAKQRAPAQVEEILLDDDSQPHSLNPISLDDIPLPKENCDSIDLTTIPLPKEEHLPDSVQITSYINIKEEVSVSDLKEEVRIDVAASSSIKNIDSYENEGKLMLELVIPIFASTC